MQNNLFTSPDFYPTPDDLIRKMLDGVKMSEVMDILEPSAGKGNIVDFIRKRYDDEYRSHNNKDIDAIEIDSELQLILKGKGYNLIHDDFLTFQSRKHYDLIIANFPFSNGDEHLAKAIQYIESTGGRLVCLVNAETLKNLNTNRRRAIDHFLSINDAKIEYLPGEFLTAERRTGVEVALINLKIEKPPTVSILLESLKAAEDQPESDSGPAPDQAIAPNDFRQAMIARFDLECSAGIKLIEEYFALKPYIMDRIKRQTDQYDHSQPLIELKIRNKDGDSSRTSTINKYLRGVRHKYWETLLRDPRFNASYTTDIMKDIEQKLNDLKGYDFTVFNIEELEKEMRSKISRGIEDAIIKLFDKFSRQFAWDESIHNGNVHYYNGWKSNKAHKINHKVIQPMNGFSAYGSGDRLDYSIKEVLHDMVKVFNFLSDDQANVNLLVGKAIQQADDQRNFRAMDLRYFETTFYKKGTCHIKFTDPDLLAKFNIFGSQRKGWLPPAYGKKTYDEMTVEEQVVIDDFQGREEYEKVMIQKDYFIVETNQLMIGDGIDI